MYSGNHFPLLSIVNNSGLTICKVLEKNGVTFLNKRKYEI